MDRLISVERHERILRRFAELLECSGKTEAAEAVNTIIKGLKLEPTVDAVEMVRCKDCKYWKPGDSFGGDSLDDMQRIGGCPIVRFARREKDFCCEGERKDNA